MCVYMYVHIHIRMNKFFITICIFQGKAKCNMYIGIS